MKTFLLACILALLPLMVGAADKVPTGTMELLNQPVHGGLATFHIVLTKHAVQPTYGAWCSQDDRFERDGEQRLERYGSRLDAVLSFGVGGSQWDTTRPIKCAAVIFDDRPRPPEALTPWVNFVVGVP